MGNNADRKSWMRHHELYNVNDINMTFYKSFFLGGGEEVMDSRLYLIVNLENKSVVLLTKMVFFYNSAKLVTCKLW